MIYAMYAKLKYSMVFFRYTLIRCHTYESVPHSILLVHQFLLPFYGHLKFCTINIFYGFGFCGQSSNYATTEYL
jgi:hypothetical protein